MADNTRRSDNDTVVNMFTDSRRLAKQAFEQLYSEGVGEIDRAEGKKTQLGLVVYRLARAMIRYDEMTKMGAAAPYQPKRDEEDLMISMIEWIEEEVSRHVAVMTQQD